MSRVRGLFETLLVRDGAPMLLEEHLARLRSAAARIGLAIPGTPGRLAARCREAAAAAGRAACRMRVVARSAGIELALEPFAGHPPALYREGVTVHIADEPGHPLGTLAGLKTVPYDAMIAAREKARERGAFEIVFRSEDGALLEGSFTNLFVVLRGAVVTPPLGRGILPGVTRAAAIRAAAEEGLEVLEEDVFEEDLEAAEEAFLTSALTLAIPVRVLGATRLVPGPAARRILARLHGILR